MAATVGERGSDVRGGGWALVAAGVVFLAVVGWLSGVLVPLGLDFAMFDDDAALLSWVSAHAGAYRALYLLYLAQQVAVLLAAAGLARRLPRAATAAAVVSVTLAAASSAALIVVTHSAVELDVVRSADSLLGYRFAADFAKALRVASEPLLGAWLVAVGWWLVRTTGRRGWWLVAVVGAWTAVVGVLKLLDPYSGFEDWVGFLVGVTQLAAGVGVLTVGRRSRAASPDPASA